jgi:DNA-binding MarR family transcriptional regulator
MATRLIKDPICACAVVREAARAVTQFYDLVLEPCGLKSTQFIALKTISEAGELPQWRFARDHALAVETLSRRLASLRKKGLIMVRTGKNHGERIYALTDQGRETFDKAIPYWERAQQRFKHSLGEVDWLRMLEVSRRAVLAARKAEHLRAQNGAAAIASASAAEPEGYAIAEGSS